MQSGVTGNGFNITLSNLPEGTVVTGMTPTVINGATLNISDQIKNITFVD
ncbi:hypothetical protein [Marinobacter sp.]|nr:hypothetical protein [Marinobacter sp.]